jgi:predicted transposase YdaD
MKQQTYMTNFSKQRFQSLKLGGSLCLTICQNELLNRQELLKAMTTYLQESGRVTREQVDDSLMKILREKEMTETIFDDWERVGLQKGLQQGLQQGRQEGRREGEAEIVLRLLNRRFKHVSKKAEKQIRELSISQIEELTDALFDFETTKDLTA